MTAAPKVVEGNCAWRGSAMAKDPRYRFTLSKEHVAELHIALESVQTRGLSWEHMAREDFPLPSLSLKLAEIAEELENGSGLAHLSGLPLSKFGNGLRHVWFGIGLNLGLPVFQNYNAQLMRDIEDRAEDTDSIEGHKLTTLDGNTFLSSKARTLSNGILRFHTDRADVAALLCVRQAKTGGVSRIASSVAVHNEMLRREPELAALLYEPLHRARLGEEWGGENLSYALPVFGQLEGRFTSHYSGTVSYTHLTLPTILLV